MWRVRVVCGVVETVPAFPYRIISYRIIILEQPECIVSVCGVPPFFVPRCESCFAVRFLLLSAVCFWPQRNCCFLVVFSLFPSIGRPATTSQPTQQRRPPTTNPRAANGMSEDQALQAAIAASLQDGSTEETDPELARALAESMREQQRQQSRSEGGSCGVQ
eukprot:m.250808 g.250808  ORF g.250808 m.250808 type:complete len:162 (-) comp19101_c0_seq8:1404-1889(-)